MEALAQYESDLVVYQNNIEIWNSMSSTDQAAAHVRAEDSSVGSYAGFVGFVVGAVAWYLLDKERNVDALFGIGMLVVSVLIFTLITPLRVLVGRLARLFVHAIFYFIGLWVVGAIISIWSPFIRENSTLLTTGLVAVVLVISAILEASGGHHASGAPVMPTKPRP